MSSEREHLLEILKSFHSGMLVTRDSDGKILSRPMAIAAVTAAGEVLLITAAASEKVEEIREWPEVNFSCQDGEEKFISISGTARIEENNEDLLEKLWSSKFQTWFPGGPRGGDAVLIHIEPQSGEYWDSRDFAKANQMFEAVKAHFSDKNSEAGKDAHGKTELYKTAR